MADPLEAFKRSFHTGPYTPMNAAGVCPMSRQAHDALLHWTKRMHEEGQFCIDGAFEESELLRGELAGFLGARASELAYFQTTAAALSQVALGLSLSPGDEIVVWDQEYPSNLYPWRVAAERSGAKVVLAESGADLSTPVEALLAKVTSKTKVIAFSWVQYRTGAITDIAPVTEFARARGIFTCADIIQGVGLLPFDFASSGLDSACGGTHKWLCAPPTVGYMLLKEEHIPRLRPIAVGAMTYGDHNSLASLAAEIRPGIGRFEPGGRSLLEQIALRASLKLIRETGIDRIAQEAEWLSRKLMHGLRERGYQIHSPHGSHHCGSIVNFAATAQSRFKSQAEIEQVLQREKISYGVRPPGVRLAPHAFNTAEQIDFVLGQL